MSSNWQHKLYEFEVIPPLTTWEKIESELDEAHLSDKFPSRLYQLETAPPAGAWNNIATLLGEMQVGHQYPTTLYNLEATPPYDAWEKIEAALEPKQKKPVPVRRLSPVMRYAAAAVLIGIISFGTFKILSSNNSGENNIVVKNAGLAPAKPEPPSGPDTFNNTEGPASEQSATTEQAREDAALEASKHTFAGLGTSDKKRMNKVSEQVFQSPADPIIESANFDPLSAYQGLPPSERILPAFASGSESIDIANRYVVLMTPDGHFIRISKKLGDMVCCVSGAEQDGECVDQMKKWRQKIADSPVTPSPGNFMDILDLLNTFKDTKL